MTTFIIAAISADGFIAKDLAQSSITWRSKGDRRFFIDRTKEAGLAIMGLNTARTSKRPLPGRRNIIYADNREQLPHWKEYEEWEVTQEAPRDLLSRLEGEGHREAAICGGSTIYTLFLKAGLVDKLYLSVEPWLFGQGIPLLKESIDQQLELLSSQKLGDQTILLEYNVLKT